MAGPVAPSMPGFQIARFAQRLAVAFGLALGVAFLLRSEWTPGPAPLILRTLTLGLVGVVVFGIFERWPRRLPGWLARWVLQVVGVGVAMPITTVTLWTLSTAPGAPPVWQDRERMNGLMMVTFFGLLLAPWTALAALLRQKEAFARHQALAFDLERSELAREALDARLGLLRAQVAPHFLFNTLANVQALIEEGSPRAPELLRSLTTYLRAAVPALDEPDVTVGRELELAQAYLELMAMRMPDRLEFEIRAEEAVRTARCPPTTLLTLVENAVRHGIDPCEDGGRIEVEALRRADLCLLRVSDTGAGLSAAGARAGTGLATLRERLEGMYGDRVSLRLTATPTRGTSAELEFPLRRATEP